jgi:hypothetical protein
MRRASATPNYLGGIGLMLEVARVCPRCGKRLPDTPSAASWHRLGSRCRPTVFAALPEPELREDDEVPLSPASRQIHDFEVPSAFPSRGTFFGGGAVSSGSHAVYRSLSAPWLRPPDLGEVL